MSVGHSNPCVRFTPLCLHHLDSALVIYCYITDDHTPRALRQHSFTSSVGQKCDGLSWALCSGNHKATVRVQLGWALIWRLREKSVSKVIQVGGRSQFFVVVELKTPFSWLSAKSYSQLLEVTHIPCHATPSVFRPQWCIESFSCFDSDFPSATSWRKRPVFRDRSNHMTELEDK